MIREGGYSMPVLEIPFVNPTILIPTYCKSSNGRVKDIYPHVPGCRLNMGRNIYHVNPKL